MNHALLPSISGATLPVKYEAAKLALAECHRLDECKDWADKSAALASYAKQAGDKALFTLALKIRSRAERRSGELLKEFEKAQGKRTDLQLGAGTVPKSRKDAATAAGMSERRAKTAIRLANVPEADFDMQIESDHPPTITALARQGTAKFNGVPHYVQLGMTKKAFQAGMYFGGSVKDFAIETRKYDPKDVVDGHTPERKKQLQRDIDTIIQYFNKLTKLIEKS